jgi:hypothetical protein
VPRWLAHFLVVVGWLLTPVLAWGASYFGLWVGALVGVHLGRPLVMMGAAIAIGFVSGLTVLAFWVRFMRRVPHLLSHRMAPRVSQALNDSPSK